MKIGFIIPHAMTIYSAGVPVQGRMWKDGLEKLGHEVYLINNWDFYDWNSFDYIIFMQRGKLLRDYVDIFKQYEHVKLVSAPIIDFWKSFTRFKLTCRYFGSHRFRIYNTYHDFYKARNDFAFYLVRSKFESNFLIKGMNIPAEKVFILPLSFRTNIEDAKDIDMSAKEPFCFFAGRLTSWGKNVGRLVEAAVKYNIPLVLAGTITEVNGQKWLDNLLNGHENIKYVGRLSDTELYDYYRRARVLALPSLVEGVGMVALEAAIFGCDVVLTNLGAPKEYFNNMVTLVNPYNIDEIGLGIKEMLGGKTFQPQLRDYILRTNNMDTCMKALENVLLENL
ncbi:MAG: glycosyltransferase [Prevotella sp.]|nr:glycosyltransferase [Prevotella sp.]